jgi:hypothetical protein
MPVLFFFARILSRRNGARSFYAREITGRFLPIGPQSLAG